MCNRYANKGAITEIRRLAKAMGCGVETTSATDNLQPQENIFPDQDAPVLRAKGEGKLELAMLRWGFPPPPNVPDQKKTLQNIRNLKSSYWRRYLTSPENRCLVPFTEFAEPVKESTWFRVNDHEIAFFAGVWTPWNGERLTEVPGKKRRVRQEGNWEIYAFLTTDANEVVRPVHEKAMPVILTDPEECKEWLGGGDASLRLQRPYDAEKMSARQ